MPIDFPCGLELARPPCRSTDPRALWGFSNTLCQTPQRTSCKPVEEGDSLPRLCLHRANTLRGWWRRAIPTTEPAVAARSSMPGAVQPPLQISCPNPAISRSADDTVQLQKTSRLLLVPFELPHPTSRGQSRAGRAPRTRRRDGKGITYGGSVRHCPPFPA